MVLAHGRCVAPRKTHVNRLHMLLSGTGGLSLSAVDLRHAASKEEFVAAVAAAAEKLGPDEWLLGGFWDGGYCVCVCVCVRARFRVRIGVLVLVRVQMFACVDLMRVHLHMFTRHQ